MDPLSIIAQNWNTITAAPLSAVLLVIAGLVLGIGITRWIGKDTLEAARERVAGAREEVERLRGEKGDLLKRLEGHGEDIAQIKTELAALPRIHASTRPPGPGDMGKDGDLWVVYQDRKPASEEKPLTAEEWKKAKDELQQSRRKDRPDKPH
jgi:hypothetical protein